MFASSSCTQGLAPQRSLGYPWTEDMLHPSLLPCHLPWVHCEQLSGLPEGSQQGARGGGPWGAWNPRQCRPPPPVPARPTFLTLLSALWPWASESAPLGLSFLTCQGASNRRPRMQRGYRVLNTGLAAGECSIIISY